MRDGYHDGVGKAVAETDDDSARLEAAVLDWLDRPGQAGSADVDEVLSRYPDVASHLKSFFADELRVRQALSPWRDEVQQPAADIVPPSFGHYTVIEHIGSGGMANVFRCRDGRLEREVAVKVLRSKYAVSGEWLDRFREEAQVASQLQHPGVAAVHEIGALPDGRPWFAMKLVGGKSMAAILAQRPDATADLPRLLSIFSAIAQTVAYAHQRNVLHRDLKPANIMVGKFGEVQVMDWGLGKVLGPKVAGAGRHAPSSSGEPAPSASVAAVVAPTTARSLAPTEPPRPDTPLPTASGVMSDTVDHVSTVRSGDPAAATKVGRIMGTLAYMAPEQAQGLTYELDKRTDVFSLGAILCEILTGNPPYDGDERKLLLGQGRDAELSPALSRVDGCRADPELIAIACRCLAKTPAKRPPDAEAVAAQVETYLAGVRERLRVAEVERARAEAVAMEERKRRRLQAAVAAILIVVALAGCGVWQALRLGREQRQVAAQLAATSSLGRADQIAAQAEGLPTASADECKIALGVWNQGLAAVDQALVEAADAGGTVAGSANEMRERIAARIAAVSGELASRQRGEHLVAQLREARLASAELTFDRGDPGRRPQKLAIAAFDDAGISLVGSTPEAIAAGLHSLPPGVLAEATASLDELAISADESAANQPRAKSLFEAANLLDANDWSRQVRTAIMQKNAARCIALIKSAVVDRSNLPLIAELGRTWKLDEDHTAPIELLRKARDRFPNDFWINVALSQAQADRAPPQYQEAEVSCRVALALVPDSPLAMSNLGFLLYQLDRADEAEFWLNRALELQPRFAAPAINLALVELYFRRDFKAAEKLLDRADQAEPGMAQVAFLRGLISYFSGKVAAARNSFESCYKNHPNESIGVLCKGVACGVDGNYSEAARWVRQAAALDPSSALAAILNPAFLLLDGDTLEAESAARRFLKQQPSGMFRQIVELELAAALLLEGKLAEAEPIARAATSPAADELLFQILVAQGKFDEAQQLLNRLKASGGAMMVFSGMRSVALDALQQFGVKPYNDLVRERKPLEGFFGDLCAPAVAEYALLRGDGTVSACIFGALYRDQPAWAQSLPGATTQLIGLSIRANFVRAFGTLLCGTSPESMTKKDREAYGAVATQLRKLAPDAFRTELARVANLAKMPSQQPQVRRVLAYFQNCPECAPLRDPNSPRLSAEERAEWQKLWAEAERLQQSLRTAPQFLKPQPQEPKKLPAPGRKSDLPLERDFPRVDKNFSSKSRTTRSGFTS